MKKFNKKHFVLLVCAALLLTFTVSGTVAYLAASTGEVKNVFEPGKVPPTVDEKTEDGVKSNVAITNSGNVSAYIRAKVVVTWQKVEGNQTYILPAATSDYTIEWTKDGWTGPESDGFYYHTAAVPAEQNTGILFTNCSVATGVTAPADGYTLHVEILAQSVQADGWPAVYNVTDAKSAFAAASASTTPTSGT